MTARYIVRLVLPLAIFLVYATPLPASAGTYDDCRYGSRYPEECELYSGYSPYQYASGYAPTVTAVYVPSMPNTGFAPTHSSWLFAGLLLVAILGIVSPYVRKAITIAVR